MSDLFKSDLVGGDRKLQVLGAKKKVDDIIEGFWKDLFAGTVKNRAPVPAWGAAPYAGYAGDVNFTNQLVGYLNGYGFSALVAPGGAAPPVTRDNVKEEVEFFYEIMSILSKSVGALGGESNLKEEVGEEADMLREEIKIGLQPNGTLPYGPGNRRLAQHVYATMKSILKDHGGDIGFGSNAALSKLVQGEADIARALNAIASAIASNRGAPVTAAPAAGGRKKYRL